jgi:hypothetical protein
MTIHSSIIYYMNILLYNAEKNNVYVLKLASVIKGRYATTSICTHSTICLHSQ